MVKRGKRRLTRHSSVPRPSQDRIASEPLAHPTTTHAGGMQGKEVELNPNHSQALWPQFWPWKKIYCGGRWKTKRSCANFTRSRDGKCLSHFPLVNVLGIISKGDWALVPNCVQMLS